MNYKKMLLSASLTLLSLVVFIAIAAILASYLSTNLGYGSVVARIQPVAALGGIFVIFCAISFFEGKRNLRHYLGVYAIKFSTALIWIIIVAFANLIIFLLVEYFPNAFQTYWDARLFQSTDSIPLLLFATLIAAPLYEELLIRGFLWQGLINSKLPVYVVIIITSLFWSVLHFQYNIPIIILIIFLGFLFGIARWKTNSIVTSFLMHFVFNVLQIANYFIVH